MNSPKRSERTPTVKRDEPRPSIDQRNSFYRSRPQDVAPRPVADSKITSRRLNARLRPIRGLRTDRTASTVIRGHAFVQNLRRGHYELGLEARHERLRVAAAFDELAAAI
jgi:hypothetical protein